MRYVAIGCWTLFCVWSDAVFAGGPSEGLLKTGANDMNAEQKKAFNQKRIDDAKKILHDYRRARVEKFQHCFQEDRSSPIDIDIGDTEEVELPELKFCNYGRIGNVTENYYSLFREAMILHPWPAHPYIEGGPLSKRYRLTEIRYSWHGLTTNGAYAIEQNQHTINGARHTAELHLIHKNIEKTIETVIVSVFVTAVNHNMSTPFDDYARKPANLSDSLSKMITFPWIRPELLLPEDRSTYFFYNGTYPDPPCDQEVTWILLNNPIQVPIQKIGEIFSRNTGIYSMPLEFYTDIPKHKTTGVFFNIGIKQKKISLVALERYMIGALVVCFVIIGVLIYFIRRMYQEVQNDKQNLHRGFGNMVYSNLLMEN